MSFDFLEQIQEKLGKHNPEDVDQLILDDLFSKVKCFTEDQKHSLEKYQHLKHLSLNNLGLTSLKNMPRIPNLEILELTNNLLKGDDIEIIVKAFPSLKNLKIGNNEIDKLEKFNCLSQLYINVLEVKDNPVTIIKKYKDTLFKQIRSLDIIDKTDRNGFQVNSDISELDEEEEEDGDYSGNEDCEDEFDDDFYEEEEDFELSDYNDDNVENIKKGKKEK
jgi:hypothetical protein